MARVSTYLNFSGSTEAAFMFYRTIFETEFAEPIMRFKDMPPDPGQPPISEADRDLVMHVELPILAGHALMGTDAPDSMGFTVTQGNNVYIAYCPGAGHTRRNRTFFCIPSPYVKKAPAVNIGHRCKLTSSVHCL